MLNILATTIHKIKKNSILILQKQLLKIKIKPLYIPTFLSPVHKVYNNLFHNNL